MSNQTHYRKVFKSDHLGVADLEDYLEQGSSLIFTIDFVRQEYGTRVAGRKIDANIAYFKEDIKPMVLNAGNSGIVKKFANSCFVENWKDITVQLLIQGGVKFGNDIVSGVRISPKVIRKQKPVITNDNQKMWDNAKKAYVRDGNFDAVLQKADISPENQTLIIGEINNV